MNFLFIITDFFKKLNAGDWILLITFLAIVWYSVEPHLLRKWQKRQAQLTLLTMHLQRQIASQEYHGHRFFPFGEDYVKAIRGIMELGKFDARTLFSPAFHYPIKKREKIWVFIRGLRDRIVKRFYG